MAFWVFNHEICKPPFLHIIRANCNKQEEQNIVAYDCSIYGRNKETLCFIQVIGHQETFCIFYDVSLHRHGGLYLLNIEFY